MARVIQIEIKGEGGQYEATVQRIIERHRQLNSTAIQGAQQTTQTFTNMQRVLITLPNLLGGVARGMVSAFSVGAIFAFGKSVIDAAGQIDDLAKRTGFSRQTLSGLKSTIEENGSTLEAFATSITRAQKSLGDIEGKGKDAAIALRAIGINVKAFSNLSPEQAFEKFAESLAKVEGQNNRVAIATRFLGREGAAQIPIILELTGKFRELREQGVSDETIEALDLAGDAITRLKNSTIGLAQEGIANILRFFGVVRDSARVATEIDDATKNMARVLAVTPGRVEGMASKEIIDAASKVPQGLQRSAQLLRDQLLNAREEFDRLQQQRQNGPHTGGPLDLTSDDERKRKAEEAARRAIQAAEAVAKLTTEQAKLNVQNLEAARTSGRLSNAMLAQGLNVGNLDEAIRNANLALIEQEKRAALAAAANDKILTPALRAAIEQQAESKVATLDAAEAELKHKDTLELAKRAAEGDAEAEKQLAEALEASTKNRDILNDRTLEAIEIERQLGDLQAERVGIIGRATDAEALRLENQIKYLAALKKIEEAEGKDIRLRDAQILTAETQLQRLGQITIDIGQHVGNTLNDVFTGLITGTLKSVDVAKAALGTVGRIATDIFQQAITKKLSFETVLFDNLRGLPGQANSALAAGASSLPGGGQSGGIGGFIQSLFGGGSGGGGGGLFSGIGDFFSNLLGGGLGNLFTGSGIGFGSAPSGVAGPLMANGGFFSSPLGGLFSGGAQGLGGLLGIGGGLFNIISQFTRGNTAGGIGGSLGGGIGAIFGGPVGFGIGSLLGSLLGGLFQDVPNPSVWVKTVIKFYYDALTTSFNALNKATLVKFEDIGGGKARQVLADHQQIMDGVSKQFVDILNAFPVAVHDSIVPFLGEANRILDVLLGGKKYSEGGSRSIERELQDLREKEAPAAFFIALRQAIGAGIGQSLSLAGFDMTAAVNAAFPAAINPSWRNGLGQGSGLGVPNNAEDATKFLEALQKFASFTGSLSGISPRGIEPFITDLDKQRLQQELETVLQSRGTAFAPAVDDLLERIQPLSDFLTKSVTESTNLFGRGLIAAMEAATASDANQIFLQSLGVGVKDIIFQGITEAFIASAQFTDLLAPIQQTIREFTQEAIASGQPPDIEAFRRAILPDVESISTRAETLAPLIAELQRLGLDVRDALGLIAEVTETVAVRPPGNININIAEFTGSETDVNNLARRLDEVLRGQLSP